MAMTSRCPLCQANAGLMYEATDRNRQLSPAVFHYFHCPECGYIFMSDPPADLARYYPVDYYSLPASPQAVAANVCKAANVAKRSNCQTIARGAVFNELRMARKILN